jgi:hypothetical protein
MVERIEQSKMAAEGMSAIFLWATRLIQVEAGEAR